MISHFSLVFVFPQWKTWLAIRSRPGPTASISWRTSSLCITKQTMRTTEDHREPSAGLERKRERELTILFIPCPTTINIWIHVYVLHMWKKNFKRHSNKSSVFIFVFFWLISFHVWVCVRGCWSLSTIYHSWMYRYLLHMIHLCIISYLHYTTRCAESKTMLKKMTELFYMLGVYYIQLPVVKRFLCRT